MQDKKNFYIDGKWVPSKSKKEIKVINPATEQECAVISLGSKEDINSAVSAAKKAYNSWAFSTKIIKKDGLILQKQLQLKWEHQKILQQNYRLELERLI